MKGSTIKAGTVLNIIFMINNIQGVQEQICTGE